MELTTQCWNDLVDQIGETFRMTDKEKTVLNNNIVAKLIAAIPYNAECNEMKRTSLTHLSTYIIAKDPSCKKDFNHNADDDADLFKRIIPLNNYDGGNKEVIERGMMMLALVQLEDHKADLESDKITGKYNPILAGSWDYPTMRDRLRNEINAISCPEMDDVMSVELIPSWWSAID